MVTLEANRKLSSYLLVTQFYPNETKTFGKREKAYVGLSLKQIV